MNAAAAFLPEKRTLLRFRGPDAVRYLNGQVSQDVRSLDESRALPACVTDAKGRLQHYIHVFRSGDDLFVEAPYDQREELFARLDRYLISDDAEIADESDSRELTHLIGDKPEGAMVRQTSRITTDGWDLWSEAGTGLPAGVTLLTQEAAEDSRIRHRLPAWGAELTAGLLPPEAGLDRTAISYRKGCYIGQEVLSRMKTAGKLNRRLAAFLVSAGAKAGDSAGAGLLTSVSPLPDPETGLHYALGFLHKSQFEATEVAITAADGMVKGSAKVLG